MLIDKNTKTMRLIQYNSNNMAVQEGSAYTEANC